VVVTDDHFGTVSTLPTCCTGSARNIQILAYKLSTWSKYRIKSTDIGEYSSPKSHIGTLNRPNRDQ
jgi:hypothetical protein